MTATFLDVPLWGASTCQSVVEFIATGTRGPMTGQGRPSCARLLLEPADQTRIVRVLERPPAADATIWDRFTALRTRAFVYLLWDGAVRTRTALALNAEEVVKSPEASSVSVVGYVVQRPCDANRFRELHFAMSARTRKSLADYLRFVRREAWLGSTELRGPLFLSARHRGLTRRLSGRAALHTWHEFLRKEAKTSRLYQLDDVVYTGMIAFLEAAGGDTTLLSAHFQPDSGWRSPVRE